VWVGLGPLVSSYKLSYTDCSTPDNLQAYDLHNSCDNRRPQPNKATPWIVAQQIVVAERRGWSCSISYSAFTYKCGVWGHLKTATVPQIQHTVTVSAPWCRTLVTSRIFIPPGSTENIPIQPNRVNIIPVQTVGALELKEDKISCTGQELKIGGHLVKDILEVKEFHVTIQEETFLIKDTSVEVQSEHLSLTCKDGETACVTGSSTFIWDPKLPACQLEIVRFIKPVRIGTLFVDRVNKIILNSTERVYLPNCRNAEILGTSYDGIFLVQDDGNSGYLSKMAPRNLRMDVEVNNLGSYIMYEAEQMYQQLQGQWLDTMCTQRFYANPGTPIQVDKNRYALLRGQVMYLFTCPTKSSSILESTNCYADVPLDTNPPSWVDPRTLLRKNYSSIIPCNPRFPVKILTEGQWLAITPHVVPTIPPLPGPPQLAGDLLVQHEDLARGGVYTTAEQMSWESLISYPTFHHALMEEISLGSCLNNRQCGDIASSAGGVPAYDLTRLLPDTESWNPWENFKKAIYENGAFLSALVLLITAVQWLINLSAMATAMFRGGPAAAVAVLGTLLCSGPRAYVQVQRRQRRQQERERATAPMEMEMYSLDPYPTAK